MDARLARDLCPMTDWISFEARIEPMVWGRNTYTILPLPEDVSDTLAARGARRVEVELNDTPFNLALTKAPVIDRVFIYTGKDVLAAAAIDPGDPIDVRLRMADPDAVEVPQDVMGAIRAAGRVAAWEALTPGKRRGLLHPIGQAKRPDTRQRRIAALLAELGAAAR